MNPNTATQREPCPSKARVRSIAVSRLNRCGFASMPVVTAIALMMTLSLLMLFRAGMMNRDQAAKALLRGDYHQREEALLRALVAVFPKNAIGCMREGYAATNDYSWATIFAEAATMASTVQSLPPDMVATLGLQTARNGDVADTSTTNVTTWITSLTGVQGTVTPGTTAYANVFQGAAFAGKVPPLLNATQALQTADALLPVVGTAKYYSTQSTDTMADVTKYPLYNLIPYPNIRFGYAAAGQPFVAKRNWWAFTVKFGSTAASATPVVAKNYVLSLYEIPSQLPIEGAAFTQIGNYASGTAWDPSVITIAGGVYGNQLSMNGGFGMQRIAGRQSIQMAGTMSLNGTSVGNDFDSPGVREQLQVQLLSDVLPVALSANSGRLSFVPIQRGTDFLTKMTTTVDGWEAYTRGVEQCQVSVEATAMVSLADQTPTSIRVKFLSPSGSNVQVVLQRGTNWPTLLQNPNSGIPFQTELTDSNRSCLTFYPTQLNAWLLANGGASVAVNNSVRFNTDPTTNPLTVQPIANPPTPDNMAVIIRKGLDLTLYTAGLSIVAPLRIYIGDDLNATPMAAAPTGSGLAAGTVFYPPLSIFGGEIRIGTTTAIRPFELHGQVTTLVTGGIGAWQPLDVKSGSDDAVHTDSIAADLKPLSSPAQLPPVHQMNWLVVVEEIPGQ